LFFCSPAIRLLRGGWLGSSTVSTARSKLAASLYNHLLLVVGQHSVLGTTTTTKSRSAAGGGRNSFCLLGGWNCGGDAATVCSYGSWDGGGEDN